MTDGQQVPEDALARPPVSPPDDGRTALITALESHVATLKANVGRLEAELVHERAHADQAIQAFAHLAERLDALAAQRSRPWWRRLVG